MTSPSSDSNIGSNPTAAAISIATSNGSDHILVNQLFPSLSHLLLVSLIEVEKVPVPRTKVEKDASLKPLLVFSCHLKVPPPTHYRFYHF